MMKDHILLAGALLTLCACGSTHTIEVTNSLDVPRHGEMVEIEAAQAVKVAGDSVFRLVGPDGTEVPWQLTYDGKVIFQADVNPTSTAVYTIERGTPARVDTTVMGKHYAWRKDDLTWENEHSAYRAYGPALEQSGERAFGYDIWTKSVDTLVVPERYRKAEKGIWFHTDYGDGLDVYSVGPTLGGGTAALLDSAGCIIYPYCFREHAILDNGPLRFTVKLIYGPMMVDSSCTATESRLISLDKGSYLNRTTVNFDGLTAHTSIAPGIVVHAENPEGFTLEPAKGYMSYADLTDNPEKGNGTIYVGVVAPGADFAFQPLAEPAGSAIGHILAKSPYEGGSDYTYYWGSGWSKAGIDADKWNAALADFALRLSSPLKTTVK